MRALLFLLLFNFALTSATTDQLPAININVTKSKNDIFLTEIPPNCCVINLYEPFKIRVYMPIQVKKKITCLNPGNSKEILFKNLSSDGDGYSVTIQKATASMATYWQCGFNRTSPFFTRPFKVHVRGERLGTLYINNENVGSMSTERTTFDSDHHYIDGEMTLFKCIGSKDSSSSQILCQNKATDEQLEVVDNKEAVLYLRLTKEYNKSYLDCRVSENKEDGIITRTIRVFFVMETTMDISKFMINEMVLTPVSSSSPEFDTSNPTGNFVYDYYDNENIIIKTLTEKDSSLRCSADGKTPYQTVKDIKLNVTLNERHNNLKLTCAMKDNRHQNDVITTLKFKQIESSHTNNISYIYGLSWANVLAQYKKNNGDIVIKYSYSGKGLQLTCHSASIDLKIWDFYQSQINSGLVSGSYDMKINGFTETRWFEMKPNYNTTTIKCGELYFHPHTEVELIRDGSLQVEDIPETDIMEYFKSVRNNNIISSVAPSTHKPTESGNKQDDGEESIEPTCYKKSRLLLIRCITVIIAIAVIAYTGFLIMKRIKNKQKGDVQFSSPHKLLDSKDYLPEDNNGRRSPMPLPQQLHCENDKHTKRTPDVGKSDIDRIDQERIIKKTQDTGVCLEPEYDYVYAHMINH